MFNTDMSRFDWMAARYQPVVRYIDGWHYVGISLEEDGQTYEWIFNKPVREQESAYRIMRFVLRPQIDLTNDLWTTANHIQRGDKHERGKRHNHLRLV